ncbi:MAG: hypothetical protein LBT09_14365 [Planctomycetaceae bacterium]|jgi:hypothetical protein|nr:hypothetical protein [Planctomycetaceae bacterium]
METGQQKPLIIDILGYLNFSSGNRDTKFFSAINSLYATLPPPPESQHNHDNIDSNVVDGNIVDNNIGVSANHEPDTNNQTEKPKSKNNKKENNQSNTTENISPALQIIALIENGLAELTKDSKTFRIDDQAGQVLKIIRDVLTQYRKFHEDILFHQSDNTLFNPFLLAKIFETIIRQGSPWTEVDRIVPNVISELNDYIGYRPIATLEGEERHEPNEHEWVAPIPLYIEGIGTANGKYKDVIEKAIAILKKTNPQILADACFDINKLDELVLDPRAYDFDHPVNRKPNYHFGLWDPHVIDNEGYYRRFVIHQVTVDGILKRVETAYLGESGDAHIPQDELLYEAGAVLAGTMLMGAGVCGDTPHTYNSETSLATLMPLIAGYRDKFYEQLLAQTPPKMRERLKREESRLYQPFGSCRQSLNKQLAKRRADQLQRMHLARIFARMGYFEAAKKQSEIISVASTRILTQIDCMITEIHFLIDHGELDKASQLLPKIEELVRRGIACGAIVDPWTILGFGANYSLFHSVENSIHDHRVDDLINIIEDIFDIYSRLQKVAAAEGNSEMQADLSDRMSDLAGWWDKYGSVTVSALDSFSGADIWESTAIVSNALANWHKAGTAAGDIAFWNRHVDRFNSTKAYVLLAEALLDQNDPVASMALMMHWLSNSEKIPLTQGDYSFHTIAMRWMEQLWYEPDKSNDKNTNSNSRNTVSIAVTKKTKLTAKSIPERWKLTKKFFDFTEANADKYWQVPKLELGGDHKNNRKSGKKPHNKPPHESYGNEYEDDFYDEDDNDDDDDYGNTMKEGKKKHSSDKDSIYSAAYENVVYQDTADDGVDGSMLELPPPGGFDDADDVPLVGETDRISERLAFIVTMSKLWKFATEKVAGLYAGKPDNDENKTDTGNTETTTKKNSTITKSATKQSEKQIEKQNEKQIEKQTGEQNKEHNVDEPRPLGDSFDEVTICLVNWMEQIVKYNQGLDELLREVANYVVPPPRGTSDSLLEYDRHRGTKEILLDRIIWTNVDVCDARMILKSFLGTKHWQDMRSERWQISVLNVNHAIFAGNIKEVKRQWEQMLKILSLETILYVPTSRGGAPWDIVRCRCIQQSIMRLMEYAPRLGLITETFRLLETIKIMEETNTVKPGAITEFDRLVETATRSITQCVSISSRKWKPKTNERWLSSDYVLVEYMERTIEVLLGSWLSHSRQIRISPVESMVDKTHWDGIKSFVQRYGRDIFTQQNMGFGNLRAMLHQGIENFLRTLVKIKKDDGEVEMCETLIEDLMNHKIEWETAVSQLELIFESIAENYSEYVDYNSTTTHSDHGDKLYMLLDMLRVQIGYERISWNLKPVYWVHDAMIRVGCDEAAHLWERAVGRRSMNAAEEHLRQYNRLSEKYGMWLPSVHERLQERFVRPLQIDRMCGLVPKVIKQAKEDAPKTAFNELYEQIENFAKDPLGVGFEMPEWLTALQDEAMATRIDDISNNNTNNKERDVFSITPHFEQVAITRAQFEKILDTLDRRHRF